MFFRQDILNATNEYGESQLVKGSLRVFYLFKLIDTCKVKCKYLESPSK